MSLTPPNVFSMDWNVLPFIPSCQYSMWIWMRNFCLRVIRWKLTVNELKTLQLPCNIGVGPETSKKTIFALPGPFCVGNRTEWHTDGTLISTMDMTWWMMITNHYNDVIMSTVASQITSLTIVYFNRLFRRRSKKTSKLRVTGLYSGNSPVTGEFPAQRASNA